MWGLTPNFYWPLVYYEDTSDVYEALTREKRLKKWRREWKLDLINKFNPSWNDLYNNIAG